MKRILPVLIIVLLSISACAPLPALRAPAPALDLAARLPLDPAIRTGVLDNGLTYYIRHNAQPAQQAELWLVVNAGSVMEADDQQGLAHFLEHMMFKGTARFPGKALLDFLESIGMRFGPEINAYTSFDETVYTLQAPTEKEADLERTLDLLQDWASAPTLAAEDFENERGVIVEEWRLSEKNATGRMQEKIVPLLLGDSQYARRMPIGDVEIVRNAPVSALVDFYRKWYRPELMAVVAVGDFDVDRMEALIRERFAGLPKSGADAPARLTFDAPAQQGGGALIVTDPENPYTTLEVFQSRPARALETVGEYRDLLLDYLVTAMLNQRYTEVAEKADAPFLQAYASTGGLVRSTDIYDLAAFVQDEKVLAGLDALMTEFERARRFGFTAGELARSKQELLRYYESADKERETSESSGYAQEYVQLFLNKVASSGIGYEYALVARLLPGVTLDEVNERIATFVDPDNRAILLQAPDKADLTLPTEAELLASVAAVEARTLEPYVDELGQTTLLDAIPEPVAVVSEQELPELGVTDLTLANGVRVIMKPTTIKKDEVLFSATSPGGNSLVSDADYPEAAIADAWINSSGLDQLTASQLSKLLAGKLVGVAPSISELDEGFSGYASPDDLETALQLVYLYATRPRSDADSFAVLRDQMETYLKNRSLEPETAMDDALSEIFCGTGIRCGALPLAEVAALDAERALAIYRDRFADFSDFTFTFVGSFDPDVLKELVRTYLGNLPSTGRQETWRNVGQDPPTTTVERTLYKGLDERAHAVLTFTGPYTPTLQNEALLEVLDNVLDIRVIDELRQRLGGAYSPDASTSWWTQPKPFYDISFDVVSDPQRVEELTRAVFDLLAGLRTDGPSETDLNKAKEQARLAHSKSLDQNSFWLGELEYRMTTPGEDVDSILQYEATLTAVTAADIRDAVRAYLPADRYIRVVLYPAGFDQADLREVRVLSGAARPIE